MVATFMGSGPVIDVRTFENCDFNYLLVMAAISCTKMEKVL